MNDKLWRLTLFMSNGRDIEAEFDNPGDALETALDLSEKDDRVLGYRIKPIKSGDQQNAKIPSRCMDGRQ
ncbi:transporter [Escherichia coli]